MIKKLFNNPHFQYLKYVLRHKYFVFLGCWHYGLIWRGLIHDWTKFLPSEWFPYVAYFYGPKFKKRDGGYMHSPGDDLAFDTAWLHHQNRNSHHYQYWILLRDDGDITVLEMPEADWKEMLADWRGAGRAQGSPDTKAWYLRNRERIILHPTTRFNVEGELEVTNADLEL